MHLLLALNHCPRWTLLAERCELPLLDNLNRAADAHGFLTLSETAEFLYKTTNYYSPKDEGAIVWNDLDLVINWPEAGEVLVSAKDQIAPLFKNAIYFS